MLKESYPDEMEVVQLSGPTGLAVADFLDHDLDSLGGSSSGAPHQDRAAGLGFIHDKDVFPDNFVCRLERPAVTGSGSVFFGFGYANNAQSIGDAIRAEQFLTATTVDLEEVAASTQFELPALAEAKIPEGGLVFAWVNRAPNAMLNLRVAMRYRTRRIAE